MFVFCYFIFLRSLIIYQNYIISVNSIETKTTIIRKTIATNLDSIYFNTTKKAICLRLTKKTITILFVFFASNVEKKIKILLSNKTTI